MMYSAIVILLTVACITRVWSFTVPTTIPPTTTSYSSPSPQVCYVNGVSFAVGEKYEEKGAEMCQVHECGQQGNEQPFTSSHFECYDSTTDKCVQVYFSQIIDGEGRRCVQTYNGRTSWIYYDACSVNGVALAVGEKYMYEEKEKSTETCLVYECGRDENDLLSADSYIACYDSILDKCVDYYSTQMLDGSERRCVPYNHNGGPGWSYPVPIGQDMSYTEAPQQTQPSQPPLPEETTQQGCTWRSVHYPYGTIPNSGGCSCDNSGYVICP